MKKIELNYLYLGYIVVFCVFIGMLIGPTVNDKESFGQVTKDEDHSMHYTHDHSSPHPLFNVDPYDAPTLAITINKDSKSGWNLHIETKNFVFTPNEVNGKNKTNQGHAHIYVDGKKLTRLYAKHYYLSDFPSGKHVISVSLNTNNHLDYAVNGKRILGAISITQY